jgi:N-acetyltransferase 10
MFFFKPVVKFSLPCIETVEGGGAVVILLKGVSSLKQLFTMTMDVHSR